MRNQIEGRELRAIVFRVWDTEKVIVISSRVLMVGIWSRWK